MRKPSPCFKCPNSGKYHNRCDEFKLWELLDHEQRTIINKAKSKYRDADAFTGSVIDRTEKRGGFKI